MNYDVIGDIHGQAAKLEALLRRMGYRESDAGWVAPAGHQAVFVGDLIDRGPEQIKVLSIIRSMIDGDHARAVMGNHELNAIGHMEPKRDDEGNPIPGQYLSNRSANKLFHHKEFLAQVGEGSDLHLELLQWLRSLPLVLDLGEIRVAHAWWYQPYVDFVANRWKDGESLPDDLLRAAYDKGSAEHQAVEGLCKGLELRLPNQECYLDYNGIRRRDVRVKWWKDDSPSSFRDVAMISADQAHLIPDIPLPEDYPGAPISGAPVFIGHYSMSGGPHLMSSKVACVDWGAAYGDAPLVAYRWAGEPQLDAANFIVGHG